MEISAVATELGITYDNARKRISAEAEFTSEELDELREEGTKGAEKPRPVIRVNDRNLDEVVSDTSTPSRRATDSNLWRALSPKRGMIRRQMP
jgi:hypothetical protein